MRELEIISASCHSSSPAKPVVRRRPTRRTDAVTAPGPVSRTMECDRGSTFLSTDPYDLNGVAAHSVVEFTPVLVAAGLEDLESQE